MKGVWNRDVAEGSRLRSQQEKIAPLVKTFEGREGGAGKKVIKSLAKKAQDLRSRVGIYLLVLGEGK